MRLMRSETVGDTWQRAESLRLLEPKTGQYSNCHSKDSSQSRKTDSPFLVERPRSENQHIPTRDEYQRLDGHTRAQPVRGRRRIKLSSRNSKRWTSGRLSRRNGLMQLVRRLAYFLRRAEAMVKRRCRSLECDWQY